MNCMHEKEWIKEIVQNFFLPEFPVLSVQGGGWVLEDWWAEPLQDSSSKPLYSCDTTTHPPTRIVIWTLKGKKDTLIMLASTGVAVSLSILLQHSILVMLLDRVTWYTAGGTKGSHELRKQSQGSITGRGRGGWARGTVHFLYWPSLKRQPPVTNPSHLSVGEVTFQLHWHPTVVLHA